MDLPEGEARTRFAAARVLRMATVDEDARPHLVPATFLASGDEVFIAVDRKPKRSQDLKRLRNIRANGSVCLIVDHYDEDWNQLWWVRADGVGRVLEEQAEQESPVRRLRAKYPQYRGMPPDGPVIAVTVVRWTGWAYRKP